MSSLRQILAASMEGKRRAAANSTRHGLLALAAAYWRMRRAWAIEKRITDLLLLRACAEPRNPPYQTNLVPFPDTAPPPPEGTGRT